MTTKTPSPIRPRFTLYAAGCQITADSPDDAVELLACYVRRFGNTLAPTAASPGYEISTRADGSLICPEHRIAATAEDRERGTLMCRFCGRTLGPVGGRMSAAPLLPEHLSGPLAYQSRGLVIPREAVHRLKQAGCVLHPEEAPGRIDDKDKAPGAIYGRDLGVTNLVPTPAGADLGVLPAQETPAAEKPRTMADDLTDLQAMQRKLDEQLAAADKADNISTDEPKIVGDYPVEAADESPGISPVSPEPEKDLAPPAPTQEIKSEVAEPRPRPALVPVRVRKPAKPPAEPEKKPPRPASSLAPIIGRRQVRDARLVDTAGSPTSREASIFKQMRQDLGVPISVVAEVSSLMLRELSAIESGELSPKPGTEKEFWGEMKKNLNQANRKWCEPRPAPPQGEPAALPKAPPRSDSRMF